MPDGHAVGSLGIEEGAANREKAAACGRGGEALVRDDWIQTREELVECSGVPSCCRAEAERRGVRECLIRVARRPSADCQRCTSTKHSNCCAAIVVPRGRWPRSG